jgi:hypothetical protein
VTVAPAIKDRKRPQFAEHLPNAPPATPGARLDLPSVALAAAGGFALVYPLIEGRQQGWPAWSFALLAAGIAIVAAFALRQTARVRRGKTPLIVPTILRRRGYVAGLLVALGFLGAMGGITLAFNVMYQSGHGFTPLDSALAAVAIPVLAVAGSITSSMLLAKLGRTTMHTGIAVMAVGVGITIVVLRAAGAGLSAWDTAAPLAVVGFDPALQQREKKN